VAAVESDWLIVPGQRIGETALGDDPQPLIARLGRPDASDAAMGKAWLVWKGHRQGNTLAVFTTYADTSMIRKAVRQIRITASRFQTASGIHTGLKLPEIRQAFPHLQPAENTGPDAALRYDDPAQGISFEVEKPGAQVICTAILVYPAGSIPTAYLPLPEPN
jgi:hypothetical protein